MKSKVEKTTNKQEQTNNVVLISGFGCFFGFLVSLICLMDFSDKNSGHKQDDGDRSSLFLAMAFKIISVICGFIYLRETQSNNHNQISYWNSPKNFAKSTEETLKYFVNSETNLVSDLTTEANVTGVNSESE